jgi:hypothetical protein
MGGIAGCWAGEALCGPRVPAAAAASRPHHHYFSLLIVSVFITQEITENFANMWEQVDKDLAQRIAEGLRARDV